MHVKICITCSINPSNQYQPEDRRPEVWYRSRVDTACNTDLAMYYSLCILFKCKKKLKDITRFGDLIFISKYTGIGLKYTNPTCLLCFVFVFFMLRCWQMNCFSLQEKLRLALEQEKIREHGRAARASSNQNLPLSVCTLMKYDEICNGNDFDQVI